MSIKTTPNYDDKISREFTKNIFYELYKWTLKDGKYKQIDLTKEDDELVGVEVEHGHWKGDFWKCDEYSLISGLSFRTINIPIRKEKYWLNIVNGKENPSSKFNIFFRTNDDFSQFIIIRPEVIRDQSKVIRSRFKPNNNDEEEDWMSFRKEDVETYNIINGEIIRD